MIIQGSNAPIKLVFPEALTGVQAMEVSLYIGNKELKHWSLEDLTIDGTNVEAPLTETETSVFPRGNVKIEVKWKNSSGKNLFASVINETVEYRYDKTRL